MKAHKMIQGLLGFPKDFKSPTSKEAIPERTLNKTKPPPDILFSLRVHALKSLQLDLFTYHPTFQAIQLQIWYGTQSGYY